MLWNIDLTLVDVAIVTRDAYADAFRQVTGRPLVKLAPAKGRPDSEIIFETLAINGIVTGDEHLPRFIDALAGAFATKRRRIDKDGRAMPGAKEALKAVSRIDGVVQSVLTGTIKNNAMLKLRAFGLERYVDFEVGGYGEEVYPKASLLQVTQGRVRQMYGFRCDGSNTVLIGDSARDVQAARIAGASMIAVASGHSTTAELHEAGADVVLQDLTETSDLVAAVTHLTSPMDRTAG
ncbi:HAD family hydrolase [Sphaerisporangium corydalis]|uniref:HAD family hydrolase n=1 Tax=Sphaerisporangium corydalis TaxID=1441875 RepID=A0ABV9ED76_9ACTN|nr:HAD hydrolase-like protein [Sphaerisporangium corydalis]